MVKMKEDKVVYSFIDLVDINAFSKLLNDFFEATGIPNGLVDPDGKLITQAGWTDICQNFHRIDPITAKRCQESNLTLMKDLRKGEVSSSLCKNGLYDYATPIVIHGQQVATLFLGQVFHKKPNLKQFIKQAEKFGFDKDSYMEAINAVPIITNEQMIAHMKYMVGVAQVLAESGLSNLKERRLQCDLNLSNQHSVLMEDLFENSPVAVIWSNESGEVEYINKCFIEWFGYSLEDMKDLKTWQYKAFPNIQERRKIAELWLEVLKDTPRKDGVSPEVEVNLVGKDGTLRHVLVRVSLVEKKYLASITDITKLWKNEKRNHAYNDILKMVAKNEPLDRILHTLVEIIEKDDPTIRCSILLLDKEQKRLYTIIAPSLPKFYNQAVNGIEIGAGVGSCGTAAYCAKRVIVENVFEHEYWEPFRDLAEKADIASCWSEPIFTSNGQVIGTFALYFKEPTSPNKEMIDQVMFTANLVTIAIENNHTREELLASEEAFKSLAENAPDNIARYDKEGYCIYANPKLLESLGLSAKEMIGARPSDFIKDSKYEHFNKMIQEVFETGEDKHFDLEVNTVRGIEHHHLYMVPEYDKNDKIKYVLVIGRDITKRVQLEHELKYQANFDFLTGLVNRRYFMELAKRELTRAKRFHSDLSLIMFDIDHFKNINDKYGHDIGDIVLQELAQISTETMREVDIVGRLGGEEFIVLLSFTSEYEAVKTAERLRMVIAEKEVLLEDNSSFSITASFGVTTVSFSDYNATYYITIDDILKKADLAMYQSKERGRNKVCVQ